ncbi:ABC transporter permease [Streptomyces litchfieldiae]|uniref:ABC transporter permease subunit n=1 Tax=Streptomyces litchfieldiae TaxID=3075543 RepID=A0ABU2MKH0_9ACTN|nr:ABC transporter permease subunit [Streptomyces sp. DSM 44938]MDT0342094.1 ABC transporter permease subunit [Streptomyces sp. DSM 44938]
MSTGTDARIHDIGYRRYEGQRLGAMYARRSLFVHSLRGAFGLGRSARSKVLPIGLFVIMCAPAVVMVAVAMTVGMDELPIDYTSYGLFMQPIFGLYLALAAPQMVSLDLRYKTIPLYFSRPIERADYVIAKFAALTAALFLFIALPLVIAYAGGLLAELGFADQTTAFGRGLVATAVFAVLHAAIGLLIASLTPRRGFGVAAIIAVLTIPYFAVLSVMVVANEQGNPDAVGWLGLFSPGSLMEGFQAKFLGGETEFPDNIVPSDAAGVAYLLVTAALIALCYVLLTRRYRKAGL